MGISLDKMRHFSKEDSFSDNKEPKDIEKKIESEIIIRKRNNSANFKGNKDLVKNIDYQIGNNQNNNEKKIHKCLSFDKYEKIEDSIKNLNLNTNNKDIVKERELNDGKDNKAIISNVEKEDMNNINNNMDESQSSEEGSDSKFNSISNKELLIINENMKSLFLSSAKSVKEEDTITTSLISDDKNSFQTINLRAIIVS